MQKIIDKIQAGELSQIQLISELVQYNEKTISEYDEACDVVENNQTKIEEMEAEQKRIVKYAEVIKNQGLVAVDYAKSLESKNIILSAENKEIKQLRNDNKSLKKLKAKHAETSKKQITRIDSLTSDCRDYRAQIAVNKSDIARLRLTGMKTIGDYSFTIFPSKTKIADKGVIETQVNLVVMDNKGNMKVIGVNSDGIVTQPKSHNFKFNDEHINFITSFDRVARSDKYQFTDRVLQMVN